MSKVLAATCNQLGEVMADGVLVPEAVVMSLGAQASSGLLFLDQDKAWYFPSSATDIQTTIEKLSAIVQKLSTVLTSIGAGMTGPTTAPPPTLSTDVAELMAMKSELDLLKEALK